MKKFNLNLKMNLYILSAVSAVFAIVLIIIISQTAGKAREDAEKFVEIKASEVALNVKNYLDGAAKTTQTQVEQFIAMKNIGEGSRKLGLQSLREVLKANPGYFAVWTMWEPNAFLDNDEIYKAIYNTELGMYNASAYRQGDEIKNQNFGTEEKPEILFDDEYTEYEEDFYAVPKETQMGAVTDPYFYSFTDDEADLEFMTSVVFPIMDNGIFLGVVGTDISLATLEQINQATKLYDTGFSAIITHSGMIAMHPDSSYIEQNISDIFNSENDSVLQNLETANGFSYISRSNYLNTNVLRSFVPIYINGTPDAWWVMTEVPVNEIYADARNLAISIIIAGIIGLLLISLVVYLISRNITRPVQRNANLMQQIAAGYLPSNIETEKRYDEIGQMSRSAEEMLNKLKEIMEKINIGSAHTASATKEINHTAQTIAQGANEQAASAEEVSATIEEMLSSLEYNKNKTLDAETIAAEARKSIEAGNRAAQESVNAVNEIAETITIINDIAGKTDLLAINAAIEAARAGNQGKGFAVVAKEIRKLAVKSQNAAQKIEELSRNSLSVSKKSGEMLSEAVPKVQNTAQIIKEIARAHEEQNRGADQIAKAVEELSSVTQANTSASEELASNSEEMEAQAEQLKEIVSFFQIKE